MIFFVIDCFKFVGEAFSLYLSQTVHFQSVDFEFLSSDPLVYFILKLLKLILYQVSVDLTPIFLMGVDC